MPSWRNTGVARFGPFEVDLEEGSIRKHGVRLKLQAQPFQILTALLENPGKAVTRDELRQRLWPDDTFVDFEHGLNAAVTRLRQALGDSAERPRYQSILRMVTRLRFYLRDLVNTKSGSRRQMVRMPSSSRILAGQLMAS